MLIVESTLQFFFLKPVRNFELASVVEIAADDLHRILGKTSNRDTYHVLSVSMVPLTCPTLFPKLVHFFVNIGGRLRMPDKFIFDK